MTGLNIACARCGIVGEFIVTEEESGDRVEEVEVNVSGGMVLYVCADCMTSEEATESLRRSAAALLDLAEDTIANFEMVFERVPGMKDHPESKRVYAEAQEQAERARAMLAALEDAS